MPELASSFVVPGRTNRLSAAVAAVAESAPCQRDSSSVAERRTRLRRAASPANGSATARAREDARSRLSIIDDTLSGPPISISDLPRRMPLRRPIGQRSAPERIDLVTKTRYTSSEPVTSDILHLEISPDRKGVGLRAKGHTRRPACDP